MTASCTSATGASIRGHFLAIVTLRKRWTGFGVEPRASKLFRLKSDDQVGSRALANELEAFFARLPDRPIHLRLVVPSGPYSSKLSTLKTESVLRLVRPSLETLAEQTSSYKMAKQNALLRNLVPAVPSDWRTVQQEAILVAACQL